MEENEDYELIKSHYENYALFYLGKDFKNAGNVIFKIIKTAFELEGETIDESFINTIVFLLKEFNAHDLSKGVESPESFQKLLIIFFHLYDQRGTFDIRNKAN